MMVQILGGLITYLLLAIYCHKHFHEKVSINRVRELRIWRIRLTQVTTTYRIRGYGRLPREFNGF
jgi:hypothetical protein